MEIPDFIEVYKGALSKDYCEQLIETIDELDNLDILFGRESSDTIIKDSQIPIPLTKVALKDYDINLSHINTIFLEEFSTVFWEQCYPKYNKKYGILDTISPHKINIVKAQKTRPSEGFHVWHCEQANRELANRIITFSVYLNDTFEAGETEFLYQQRRLTPSQGDLVIFPAGYTHTHRGNPPIGGNKYIITGWVEWS